MILMAPDSTADVGLIDEGGNAADPEIAKILSNFLSSVRIWVVTGDHVQLLLHVASEDQLIGERVVDPFALHMKCSFMERMVPRGHPYS